MAWFETVRALLWGEERKKIVKDNFMNAAQGAIIEREFHGKAPDDPKVKARVADIQLYFEVAWKGTGNPLSRRSSTPWATSQPP